MNIILILITIISAIICVYIIKKSKIVYHAPSSYDIKNRIFLENNKKYKLVPQVHICPINISMSSQIEI